MVRIVFKNRDASFSQNGQTNQHRRVQKKVNVILNKYSQMNNVNFFLNRQNRSF